MLPRLKRLAGDPVPDGVEVDRAAYFSREAIAALADDDILAIARNGAVAALTGGSGC